MTQVLIISPLKKNDPIIGPLMGFVVFDVYTVQELLNNYQHVCLNVFPLLAFWDDGKFVDVR